MLPRAGSRRPLSAAVALCALTVGMLASSCVGKGRYLDALLSLEQTRAELAVARTDLGDASAARDRQTAEVLRLRQDLQAARELAQAERTSSLTEQQLLGDRAEANERLAQQQRARISALEADRARLSRAATAQAARVDQLRARLGRGVGSAGLERQAVFATQGPLLTLTLPAEAFFGPGGKRLSESGRLLCGQLAGALGGQMDLAVAVVAYPVQAPIGTAAAWSEASARANAVAHELVDQRGLLPRLVAATARVGRLADAAPAPAEAGGSGSVVLEVRVDSGVDAVVREVAPAD